MKILCIAADLIPQKLGGAEVHVVEVVKRLAKKHQITLVVGPQTAIKKILPDSIRVIPVAYPKIPNLFGLSFILFGFFRLQKLEKDFDLIWAKQCFPQAPLAVLIKKKLNRPLYVTAQNPMLHQEELVIKGRLLSFFKKPLTSVLTPLISWSLKKSDLVAAVSTYSEKLAHDLGAKKTTIIPNGIDQPTALQIRKIHTPIRLITTSSLIPRNGIDILIKSLNYLPKEIKVILTIAGEGPEKNRLESLTKTLPNTKQVRFLGRVENTQIPDLLQRSDIFIRPSVWEGFGVSFIEAMAHCVPVIATPVGGIVDYITHKKTGMFAIINDPESVAQQIQLLTKDHKLRIQIVKNAHALVKSTYTWDRIATLVEKEMLKLCQSET